MLAPTDIVYDTNNSTSTNLLYLLAGSIVYAAFELRGLKFILSEKHTLEKNTGNDINDRSKLNRYKISLAEITEITKDSSLPISRFCGYILKRKIVAEIDKLVTQSDTLAQQEPRCIDAILLHQNFDI